MYVEGLEWGIESAQNMTPEKLGQKALHTTVAHACGDHAQLCSIMAFESERSCCALLTP